MRDSVSIGTSLGNSGHLAFALAMKAAGVDIRKLKTVAFNSAGEGVTALLGGHIDMASTPPPALLQHVHHGANRHGGDGGPVKRKCFLYDPLWL
jgi:putative tricarboxylic transport membrane protein